MFVQDRQSAILTELGKRPRWTVTGLQRALRVSRSTLRRDLIELQNRGELLRVHGGVVNVAAIKGEPSLDKRARRATEAKHSIAVAVAKIIPSGATVFIDAGTTCLQVGRQLLLRGDVRIVTHSIRLLIDSESSSVPITCVGGDYRAVSQAVVGGLALDWMKHLRCDVAVIGASGLSDDGASTTEVSETAVKQAAMRISGQSILVADSEKWDNPAAVQFTAWDQFDHWITDAELPAAARKAVGKLGVDVTISGEEEE